ncbi:hypothetical protein XaFJ1_GM003038 [Xanthomonas albilineans]|nr:hypothetical protein XaFJ1_GM003038 [Xanthomonas albilineans]
MFSAASADSMAEVKVSETRPIWLFRPVRACAPGYGLRESFAQVMLQRLAGLDVCAGEQSIDC